MSMDDHDKVEAKVVDDDDDDDEAGELSTAPVVVAQECLHTEPLEKSVQEMVDEPGHDVKEETDAGVVGTADLQPVSPSTRTEENVEEDRNVAETKVTSNDESETILTAADTASDGGDFSRDEQRTMDPLAPRILFDDSLVKVQAFVDSGEPGNCKINDQWKSKTEKVLKFDAPVYRVSPAKYFWSRSRSEYEKRILAVYSNPDIILVLRYPRCEEEVRRLITPDRPRNDISYLIVESVVDSSSCKLRLSRLTHATAIPSKPVSDKDSPIRRQTSFEIITPTEIIELSAVNRSHDAPDSAYANKDAFNCTLKVQNILTDAIVNVFGGTRGDENHWKHQVVLGTPHSYVLRNEQTLQQSLSSALEIQKSRHKTATSQNKLDCTTIDSREDGQTALHLACIQQKSKMVQLLVDAGADCSIPQLTSDFDDFTPCHLCANCLDYKTLSILLSSTYPARPDPNSLDARGRTPMYLAAVKGQGSDDALHLCLSALEAWGGQMTADSPDSRRLHQPLHIAASFWKHKRLSIILSHSGSYRYPLKTGVRAAGMSLGALHQYPIHAALISLRARLSSNGERDDINPNDLVNTITALLEHGFEPNERIEGTEGDAEDMNQYFGFAPLHILALTAKDVLALSNCSNSPEEVSSIQVCIKEGAQALLMRGARINLDPPPTSRLDRPVPPGCVSHGECPASSFAPEIGRKELRLDDDSVVEAFGGSEVVSVAQRAFSSSSRTVRNAGGLLIGTEAVDSDAPGGSDSESCAITWSEFGMITNRRHLCRTSLRWVANDDSTKRIVDDNGREHRISDGQYNLAVAEAQRVETKAAENRMAIARRQRQSAIDARESLGLQGARKQSSSGADRENSDKTPSAADRISSAFSALGQARDAVLDRGDKLSSLQDKTEKLEQASLDFANMAKELNRSQNS
ncbi:hypothetical protein THAOC_01120, partial [Thalassiosira oceanica]